MIIVVIDGETTWKFNTLNDNEDELMSFFENLGKEGRTFKKMELDFEEGVTLTDINNMFSSQNGEGKIVTQTLILNPKEDGKD